MPEGLKTPSNCELVVGGEPQCWAEGRCLLFDDSFLHTAFHEGKPYVQLVGLRVLISHCHQCWGAREERAGRMTVPSPFSCQGICRTGGTCILWGLRHCCPWLAPGRAVALFLARWGSPIVRVPCCFRVVEHPSAAPGVPSAACPRACSHPDLPAALQHCRSTASRHGAR